MNSRLKPEIEENDKLAIILHIKKIITDIFEIENLKITNELLFLQKLLYL